MKHLQNNWRPLLAISLLLALAIYFRAFVVANIFEPVAMLFWAVWRIVASIHQNVYWVILVLACFVIVARLMPFRRNIARSAYRDEHSSVNRVESWLRLMKNAPLGTDETDYLRDDLKRLLVSIQRLERSQSVEPDGGSPLDATPLPPTVHGFLFPANGKHKIVSGDGRLRLLFWMPKWFRRWVNRVFRLDNPAIEETLAWMESLMEINNDQ